MSVRGNRMLLRHERSRVSGSSRFGRSLWRAGLGNHCQWVVKPSTRRTCGKPAAPVVLGLARTGHDRAKAKVFLYTSLRLCESHRLVFEAKTDPVQTPAPSLRSSPGTRTDARSRRAPARRPAGS